MVRPLALGLGCLALLAAILVWWPIGAGLVVSGEFLLWVIVGATWMDRRSARRLAQDRAVEVAAAQRQLPAGVAEFLATLERHLDLPSPVRAEIRLELADHLEDSIAGIMAEGLDADRATREAIARLGRPEELARQLRHAHQTTRRLLAGAAGGVVQVGAGAIEGYLIGLLLLIVGFFLVAGLAVVLRTPLDFLAGRLPQLSLDSEELAGGSVIACMLAWPAAFMAGRRSVRACARASRRTVLQLGPWWATIGALALGYVITFQLTVWQSWLVVPMELLIPAAFAAGVLLRWKPRLPSVVARHRLATVVSAWLLSSALMIAALMGASVQGGESWSSDMNAETATYDAIAPAWPGDELAHPSGGAMGGPAIDSSWQVQEGASLAGFTDLEFEAWRAVHFSGAPDFSMELVPDTAYSSPFVTRPAVVENGNLTIRLDVSHVRTTRWLVFLTGVGSDGHRYRLGWPDTWQTTFSGTIWDWLTASNQRGRQLEPALGPPEALDLTATEPNPAQLRGDHHA